MNITRKVYASLATLLVACLVHAADSKPVARVVAIQEVETEDPSGYATWLAKANDAIKAKTGVEGFYHVYTSVYDGGKTNSVRIAAAAESVAALQKITSAIENDPVILENRDHYRAIRKLGARVLYQAVRFDGTNKNGAVFTSLANITDEAGYLKALDGLRALLDKAGFKDAKINVYRALAGRTNHTHRVAISLPNQDRLAAFLDFTGTDAGAAEWIANAAKFRTTVANSTSREITK